MPETAPVVKYAEETGDYRSILIRYLDELTLLYESLSSKIMSSEYDHLLLDATISKMVSIMFHLLPKLEGGGEKTAALYKEFEQFKPWMNKVIKPKTDKVEAEKIPDLYGLIIKAYHQLNISNM